MKNKLFSLLILLLFSCDGLIPFDSDVPDADVPEDGQAFEILLGENTTFTKLNYYSDPVILSPSSPGAANVPADFKSGSADPQTNTLQTFVASNGGAYETAYKSGNVEAEMGLKVPVIGPPDSYAKATVVISYISDAGVQLTGGGTSDAILYWYGFAVPGEIRAMLTSGVPDPDAGSSFGGGAADSISFSRVFASGDVLDIGAHLYVHSDVCDGYGQAYNDLTITSVEVWFTTNISANPGDDHEEPEVLLINNFDQEFPVPLEYIQTGGIVVGAAGNINISNSSSQFDTTYSAGNNITVSGEVPADNSYTIYLNFESIDSTFNIKNSSDTAFQDFRILLPDGTQVSSSNYSSLPGLGYSSDVTSETFTFSAAAAGAWQLILNGSVSPYRSAAAEPYTLEIYTD